MSVFNNQVFENIQVTSQEYIIIKSIEKFYENNYNIEKFLKILNGQIEDNNISIRLIDYFVTKYSKNNKINYKIYNNNTNTYQTINIFNSYKQQLKAYQKKNFDPFSRGFRIPYFLNEVCIITTISQLNFFKWFFTNEIYEYIIINHKEIELEMNYKNKSKPNKKKDFKPKKKIQSFKSIIPVNNYNTNIITVTFTV